MKANSLAFRLAVGAAVWSAALLIVVGLLLSSLFGNYVERSFDSQLSVLLDAVVAASEIEPGGTLGIGTTVAEGRFDTPYSGWYWQVSDAGGVRLRSRSLWDQELRRVALGRAGDVVHREDDGPDGQRLRLVARVITFPDAEQSLLYQVGGDLSRSRGEVARFNKQLGWSLALLFAGLLIAVVVQIRFGLRPLRRIRESLARIRHGDIDRLDGSFPAEIAPLAQEINVLLQHNAHVLERARTHVGNLAHALKTPITIIANEAAAAGPSAATVAQQVVLVRRQIDHHLARARTAATVGVLGTRTDVRPVLHGLERTLMRIHADRRIDIEIDCDDGLAFAGERQDLEEMLGNLLDNGCKWAAATVNAGARRDRGGLEIVIDDDGPGLAAAERIDAVDRGRRLDESVPGSGLGLAIVNDIAALYDGSLTLEDAPAGGLRAVLRLPLAETGAVH